jgi:hypothetical protein
MPLFVCDESDLHGRGVDGFYGALKSVFCFYADMGVIMHGHIRYLKE